MGWRVDKLGIVAAALAGVAVFALPFASFRANRIVPGLPKPLWEALPAPAAGATLVLLGLVVALSLPRLPALARLLAALIGLGALAVAIGLAPGHLTPPGNSYARVAPAAGFWLLSFVLAILVADALTRLRPRPAARLLILLVVAGALGGLLASGLWDGLSILKEYSTRAASFWREGRQHVALAFGSLLASTLIGIPLGILCHRLRPLRDPVLNLLNVVQTVPSIALFGLLIAPLGWIALHVPGATALGIRGIGAAPALVALFLYSLLPVVANTVVGLAGIPPEAEDAAKGLGMTSRQRLFRVELPLALPVILTGIRIVLVQNIGLATVAALIGGGGFGIFVFQGIGQTAMDLVLLGAVPTVALAFAAAVILDAAVEAASDIPAGGPA
ncbi:ABC transporter permease [Aureimonas endophytica]|uniref:ABC transporter permease n=1 Tax=Aureimonas endophytica TaxID=2027858 RepID=A0A916ZUY4_9HYPH|nr:ABC transporter permease [Aureimonas endophytica]GGE13906.1 ABC transporter permease [Aureimonas endophytica]